MSEINFNFIRVISSIASQLHPGKLKYWDESILQSFNDSLVSFQKHQLTTTLLFSNNDHVNQSYFSY